MTWTPLASQPIARPIVSRTRQRLPICLSAICLLLSSIGTLSLLTACAAPTGSAPPLAVVPAPTPTPVVPRPVVLPADEAPHDALSEWWYYTGHLRSASGGEYGFEFVVFQAVRSGSPVGYAAHFAVTDHSRGSFTYEERSESAPRIQGDGRFSLDVAGWRMEGDGDDHRLQAQGGRYAIDLRLHSTKPPALHNGTGWISFGPVGDSYYYSRTRMEVEGTIVDAGRPEPVTGLAWMDHQWGDFVVVNGGGWDWFSIQLSDGSDVMLTVLRDQPGNVAATYGTLVEGDGRATDLGADDVQIAATGSWVSPRSGARYPSGWKVRLPRQGIELDVQPVLSDQELDTRQSTGVAYWEGDVRATGARGGAPISGAGYVELTGYAR